MTIPYLPGWGDNLAQALPQLGQGIAHIINPQMDQQMALKAAIMKDPSILREYASIERKNPGTLKSLGFGENFGNVIGSIQATPEEALKEKEASSINAALSTPEGKRAYGHKAAFGETESETASRTAEADLAKSQKAATDLNAKVTQTSLDELERKNKTIGDLFKKIPDLSGVDIHKLAADASFGRGDPTMLARIQADPTIGPVFRELQNNILERAKLAIEQGRLDELKKGNKGQMAVAVNESLKFQKEAEKRVQQLQALQQKYSNNPKALEMDRLLAPNNPDMAAQVQAYDGMVKNNFSDLNDAKKDAKRYRAMTLELMKMNPEIKAAIDKLDAEDAADEKKNSNKSTTTTPIASSDPVVQQAQEAIASQGLEKVQGTKMWKKLTPEQQQAAVGFSATEPTDSVKASKVNKPYTAPGVVVNDTARSIPSKSKEYPGTISKDSIPLKNRARGTGEGATVSRRQLTPYEVMLQQLRDVVHGNDIGDYTDDLAPEYQPNAGTSSPMLPPNVQRLPRTGPTIGPRIR